MGNRGLKSVVSNQYLDRNNTYWVTGFRDVIFWSMSLWDGDHSAQDIFSRSLAAGASHHRACFLGDQGWEERELGESRRKAA